MSNSCESKEACAPEHKTASGGSECCDMPEKLLCLADEAWREALKEKMKEHILKHSAEHLDKIASVVTEANHKRWTHKIAAKQQCNEYSENLRETMVAMTRS